MKKISMVEYFNAVSVKPNCELTIRERKVRKKLLKAIRKFIKQ